MDLIEKANQIWRNLHLLGFSKDNSKDKLRDTKVFWIQNFILTLIEKYCHNLLDVNYFDRMKNKNETLEKSVWRIYSIVDADITDIDK